MSVTLGLDLGPNSIGWALVDETNQEMVALGSRIFPEGVDNFDTAKERSRNEDRRVARGMRRQVTRRVRRRRKLRDALIEAGLFPADPEKQAKLYALDPYKLRARAVQEKLSPHQIGRVFLHLNQRRGFLSNSKRDKHDKEVQGMLAEIQELDAKLGDRTLGQFLYEKSEQFDHIQRKDGDRVRRRHTARDRLEDEFDRIWDNQAKHHPELLTERFKYGSIGKQSHPCKPRRKPDGASDLEAFGIHGLIFFQRQLYWPKSMIGLCELEPKQPRCPRADRRAQRFRLLQEVNNLRHIDPDTHTEQALSDEQRALLLEKLSRKKDMEFKAIRKALGFLDTVRFNLERGKRPKLMGMVTDWMMAKEVDKEWHKRSDKQKTEIVELLLDPERDEDALHERLVSEFGLTSDQANNALAVDFTSGYLSLSRKALDRLLPHMEEGLLYVYGEGRDANGKPTDALHAAEYDRPDELQRRIFDKLPDPERTNDHPIGEIPNPVVRRALVELRKLINAILREERRKRKDANWRPDAVHIEMGRDLKTRPTPGSPGYRKYMDRLNEMREREAQRDDTANKLREKKKKVTRDAINRHLLWREQNYECVYCGKTISQDQFFGDSGDVDVDHILPYSRCLDDSQMNKVVCHRWCNDTKGQRSPYEWLSDSRPDDYEAVCQRAKKLSYPKYRRFLLKELELDTFIARQLVDTRYFAKATAEYLRCLFSTEDRNRGAVLGLKGQLTAELRHQWGLNDILRDDGLDLKSRDDHRHHAIDAVIVALTDRSRLHQLTRIRKAGGVLETGEALDFPWDAFRDELVENVNTINVSHRAERKVAGALHEDTFYGPTEQPGVFVVRKPLDALSPNEIELIRDERVKQIIKGRLAEHGIEVGRGKGADTATWKKALCDPENPVRMVNKKGEFGPPIRKVRVLRSDQTIQRMRERQATKANDPTQVTYVKPGATHHLSLFEYEVSGKMKRDAVFTTMLEAINRVKKREPIITRTHPDRSDARFLFSLSRGEVVLAKVNGRDELLVYNTAASTTQQMAFYQHTDARPKSHKQAKKKRKKFTFKPNTLNARKVTVDPLGRVRWTND